MQNPDVWSDTQKVSKLGAELREIKENIVLRYCLCSLALFYLYLLVHI